MPQRSKEREFIGCVGSRATGTAGGREGRGKEDIRERLRKVKKKARKVALCIHVSRLACLTAKERTWQKE